VDSLSNSKLAYLTFFTGFSGSSTVTSLDSVLDVDSDDPLQEFAAKAKPEHTKPINNTFLINIYF
jgi:hypothetical protein